MKCPNCNGVSKEYSFYDGEKSVWKDSVCPTCNGTGSVEQTNEEWFCGLSTEDKAEWLSKHFHCGDCILEKPMCGGEYDGCKSAFVEWLKEKHDA